MSNKSVVVNYQSAGLFTSLGAPDIGYVQFTRSGEFVYISVDGKPIGRVPTAEFARIQILFEGE